MPSVKHRFKCTFDGCLIEWDDFFGPQVQCPRGHTYYPYGEQEINGIEVDRDGNVVAEGKYRPLAIWPYAIDLTALDG